MLVSQENARKLILVAMHPRGDKVIDFVHWRRRCQEDVITVLISQDNAIEMI